MACSTILSGIATDCGQNMGGVKDIWIAPYSDIKTVTLDEDSKQMIKTITYVEGKTDVFQHYSFKRGAASLTKTATIDATNNIHYVVSEVLINFAKMETSKRIEMNALLLGEVAIIVKDANGTYWYLGYEEPVLATAATGQTGQAKSDANQYTITLTDESHEFPFEVHEDFGKTLKMN